MTWYSTGTVTTVANSVTITGKGTGWTQAGLRAGDMLIIGYNTASPRGFEIKSIDSPTQITLVLPFPVAVTDAAYVAIPMLSGDRTAITMTLATQTTKAFADNQAMQAVWQAFYSGSGTVTLTMPDGSQITGSSFLKLTEDLANKASLIDLDKKAAKGANNDITSITGLKTALSITMGGTGAGSLTAALSNLGLSDIVLAGTISGVFGGNGYVLIPVIISGVKRNLIIQWGLAFNVNATTTTTTFPIPFPTSRVVVASGGASSAGFHTIINTVSETNSSFTWSGFTGNTGFVPLIVSSAGGIICRWYAIGF